MKNGEFKNHTSRTRLFHLLIIGVTLAFLILTVFVKLNSSFPLDLDVTRFIQTLNYPWFDAFMKLLTFIGILPMEFLLLLCASTVFIYLKKKKDVFMLLFSTLGANTISFTLKRLIGRSRPDPELVLQMPISNAHDSFPSGHVLFYIGFFGFLLFLVYKYLKPSLFKTLCMSFLGLLLSFIGISRIYLGAHWFSDVLGAYLVGFLWLTAVIHIYKKIK